MRVTDKQILEQIKKLLEEAQDLCTSCIEIEDYECSGNGGTMDIYSNIYDVIMDCEILLEDEE